jgi:hypothetical protein
LLTKIQAIKRAFAFRSGIAYATMIGCATFVPLRNWMPQPLDGSLGESSQTLLQFMQ